MKVTVKTLAISASIVAVGATATIFAFASANKVPVKHASEHLDSVSTTTAVKPTSTQAAPADTSSTSTAPVSQQTTTTQPSTTSDPTPAPAPQPAYGQDPSNGNIYRVFDQTSVMTSAGIDSSQQSDAAATISTLNSQWTYYNADPSASASGQYAGITLCNTAASKLGASVSDWKTNPIGQLSYCNQYVTARYGNWGVALSHIKASGVNSF